MMAFWGNVLSRQIDHLPVGLQTALSDCWGPSRMELQEVGPALRTPQKRDELMRVCFPVWHEYRGTPKTMSHLFSRVVLPWCCYQVLRMINLGHLRDATGWAHSHGHLEHEDWVLILWLVWTEEGLFDFHWYPMAENDGGEQHGGDGVCDDGEELEADVDGD